LSRFCSTTAAGAKLVMACGKTAAAASSKVQNLQNAGDDLTSQAKGGVYVLRDPTTKRVMRVGRTNNLLRRQAEHARNPQLKYYRFKPIHHTDSYMQQRGLEQMLYDKYAPPLNKIRPISPRNPNLQSYLNAAKEFLE